MTGCTETESVIVPAGPGALVGSLDITNVVCSGDSSGTVILSATGGTPPYTFDWTSLGIVSTSLNTADTISGLTAGTYDVILTDASSCEFTTTFTITEPNPLVFRVDTVANPSCAENGDGLIEVRADGGVRPYTYSWSGGVPVNVVNDMVVANGLFNGSYVLTIVDSVGCTDSISFNLSTSAIVSTFDTVLCFGESITVNGNVYDTTVVGAVEVIPNIGPNSCDSTVTFNVTVLDLIVENIDTTICQGQSLTVNGVTYNTAGSYVDTAFYSQSGCDSVRYAINLQIDSFVVETIDTTICQGQSLLVNGVSYTTSGLFNDTAFYAASGCDSIQYVIDLQIDSFVVENIDTVLCFGESIVVNGVQYDATGFYQDTLFYPSGCDQIQYNIDLEVLDEKLGLIDTAICDGESIVVNGTEYSVTTTGAQEVFVVGPYGCDSIVTINLQVNDLPALNASANPDSINNGLSTELVAVGNGDFIWESIQNDSIYVVTPSETSTYTVELIDANGCVTEVSVTVYVLGASEEEIKIPDAFTPNGDGINDVFRMVAGQTLGEVELIIYNRWGDNLFQQTGDSGIAWDGTYQGQEQANDVYIYLFRVKTLDDKEFFFQGEVTLYR